MIVSLQQTPPDAVFAMIVLRSVSLSLKIYNANGLSLNEKSRISKFSFKIKFKSFYLY